MSDKNENSKNRPTSFDSAISEAFNKFAEALAVVPGRQTRMGINPRLEIDEDADGAFIELRKMYDLTLHTPITYPSTGDNLELTLIGQSNRIAQYEVGDLIEIVDINSLNEQSHMFFRLLSRTVADVVLQFEAGSPHLTTVGNAVIYRTFRKKLHEFTSGAGESPVISRTKIITENR